MENMNATALETLKQAIRTVPDFPEPGIQFKDITPVLGHPELLRLAIEALLEPFQDQEITKVVGIESRGFILGGMLAHHLDAGFVPVRKKGKLPYQTLAESYQLEYGTDTIEMHIDAIEPGDRVLIHDDVIATGGTAEATIRLVERAGGEVVGCAFLIELTELQGRKRLPSHVPIHTVLQL
ncbi:adenine phosphoribosyltransferase [Rhodothermus marinus]|nr:adenine phosphoribosyltransferase [Rhodothermus marinus]